MQQAAEGRGLIHFDSAAFQGSNLPNDASAQPRDHAEFDGVALGDLGQRLAGGTALDSFLAPTSEQYQGVRAESPTMTSMAADSFTFPAACASRGLIERALERSEDRGLSDLVVAGKLRHGLAGGIAFGDFAFLAYIQRGWPAELLALRARLEDAGLGACEYFLLTSGDIGPCAGMRSYPSVRRQRGTA